MNNLTLLIDGPSLIYRAFFAIQREMTTSKGVPTKAVYGFSTMLGRLLSDYNPANVAVCFDRRGPTFRHEEYKDYKAGRPPMPDDLGRQFPLIKEILSAMNIAVIDAEGYEADDIIGTLAKKASPASPVLIVTSDRDLLQLATEETKVLITIKGVSQFKIFGKAEMLEEYGFCGESFVDYKALRGDPSDNIPGVRGIGEKTAIELIKKFGSIENLENNIGQIAKKGVRDKLIEDKISLHMSKKLATIFTDVPLDIKEGGIKRGVPNYAALEKIYRELEMNQFLRMMINEEEARRGEVPPLSRSDILSPEPKGSVPPPVPSEGVPSVPSASTPPPAPSEDVNMGTEQKGVQQSFSTAPKAEDKGSISTSVPSEDVSPPARSDEISLANNPPLAPAASAPAPTLPDGNGVIGHNIKAMMVSGEIPFDAKIDFDTELAMYLLNPAASDYVPPIDGVTKEFCEGLRKELEEENLLDVFERVELPLIPILAKFETYGIKTDREILASESSKLKKKIDSLAEEICADAGEAFNVNSPKQLAEILYGKLGLPVLKKTKTGPSTKADVLEKLAEKNPIVKKILEHRQLAKLYGTYAEGLIKQIGADGRIYAKWEQTRTATGRLSSKDPNMQNLPIREERGREIRKAFLPGDGKIFVSADYSQIELRVLAHMSGDENLLEDFRTGADIHVRTAARILGIGESDVTQQLRSRAKAVNFGIIYGMSAFGLSEGVGITPAEAESFIKDYFDIYQGVRTFMDSQVLQAKTTGVVRTILGRKRNVPEIYSKNYMLRKLGERLAQNSPIQGSAADIIKLAMIAVRARLKKESLDERALEILQLHDEIVIETDADIKEEVKAILKEEMESAIELKVPLIVSLAEGRSLYELK